MQKNLSSVDVGFYQTKRQALSFHYRFTCSYPRLNAFREDGNELNMRFKKNNNNNKHIKKQKAYLFQLSNTYLVKIIIFKATRTTTDQAKAG